MNTFSKTIVDIFGAVWEKKNKDIVLVFDEEKINRLKIIYWYDGQDQEKDKAKNAAPIVFNEPTEVEDNNPLEDDSEGCESSEGPRICRYIIDKPFPNFSYPTIICK